LGAALSGGSYCHAYQQQQLPCPAPAAKALALGGSRRICDNGALGWATRDNCCTQQQDMVEQK